MKRFERASTNTVVFFLVLHVLCFSSMAYSQSVFHSPPISFGTQAAALGNAYAAHVQDVSSMYWNPAAISFLEKRTVVVNAVMDSQTDVFHHMVAAPLWHSDDHFLAAGIVGSHFGRQWYRPYFSNYGVDIGYCAKLTPFLSVGTLVNLRYGQIIGSSLWAGSGTLGLLYYPSRGITYGIRLGGLGPGIVYRQEGKRKTLSYDSQLPKGLTLGSTFRFPTTTSYSTVTLSFDCGLDLRSRDLTNGFGFELSPWKALTLRVGLARENTITMFRYGAGIQAGFLQVDYAYVPLSNGNHFHHSSLSVSFANW